MKKIKIYYRFKPVTHKQLRKTLIWTTGDGRDVKLKDFTDQHLVNTALYLNRKLRDIMEFSLPNVEIGEHNVSGWVSIFTNEIKYRGL